MTKPDDISSPVQFLELLAKSGLLPSEQFAEAERAAAGNGDAKGVARFLLKKGWLTTWQAGQLLCGFHRLLVGNYRLCTELGRGFWGRVYLAEHVRLGRRAAVQIVSPRHAERPQARQRFLEEAKVSAALEHRNIIQLFDIGRDGDRWYAVREFVPGEDLRQRVQKLGPLPLPLAMDCVVQACCGLEYLHARGIVHGGLRPSSLLLSEPGIIKILDVAAFGRSRILDDRSEDDASRTAIRYWSPEQIQGSEPDAATDIYSLGCCLHVLLTGRVASGASRDDQGDAVQAGPTPLAISSLRPDAPPPLAVLCERMMAARREDRIASARAVREQLEALLRAQPLLAAGPGPAARRESVAAEPTSTPVAAAPEGARGDALSRGPTVSAASAATELRVARETQPVPLSGTWARRGRFLASCARSVRGRPRAAGIGLLTVAVGLLLIAIVVNGGRDRTPKSEVAAAPGGRVAEQAAENPSIEIPERTFDQDMAPAADVVPPADNGPNPPAAPAASDAAAAGPAPSIPPLPESKDGPPMSTPPEVPAAAAATSAEPPPASPAPDKPVTEKPPAEKPAAETPVAEKPGPEVVAEPVQPVFEFAAAVDLPPVPSGSEAAASTTLGKVRVKAEDVCFMSLFGGENALRGRGAISLRNARDGTAPRDWEIVLSDSGGQQAVVASLALPEQELKFAWSAEAAQRPAAECVRNCGLKITAGQVNPQEVILRTPVSVPPLTLDLDKPSLAAKWTIDALPDPEAIRAVVRLDGHPFLLEPAEAVRADAGTQWVYLGDNREQVAIALQVKTGLSSRGLELSVLPLFFVPGQPAPERMTKTRLNQFRVACGEGKSQRQRYQALVEQLQEAKKAGNPDELQNPLLQANEMLRRIDALTQRLDKLEQTLKAVNRQAKMHLRVYFDTGAKEVDLLLTNASSPNPE